MTGFLLLAELEPRLLNVQAELRALLGGTWERPESHAHCE